MAESNDSHPEHAAHHDVTLVETDRPKNPMILGLVIGTVAALIVTVAAIVEFFDISVRSEIDQKVLSQPNPVLLELRAQEDQKLNHYSWVNQKTGVLRIPVDRAMKLVLKEWDARPTGLVAATEQAPPPPAPAPGTAPAPGAAPTPGAKPGAAPAPGAKPGAAPASGTKPGAQPAPAGGAPAPAAQPARPAAPPATPAAGAPQPDGGK